MSDSQLDVLGPYVPMSLIPPMPSIATYGTYVFYASSATRFPKSYLWCLSGSTWGAASWAPGPATLECQGVPDLIQKSLIFRTPPKAVPSGPRGLPGGPLVAFSARFGTKMPPKMHPKSHRILESVNSDFYNPSHTKTVLARTGKLRNAL